jgi:hypothetical protein
MAAYLLTMFLLGAVITICHFIVISIIVNARNPFAGAFYLTFLPLIVYILGFSMVISMPKKVEGWVMGDQKKRR